MDGLCLLLYVHTEQNLHCELFVHISIEVNLFHLIFKPTCSFLPLALPGFTFFQQKQYLNIPSLVVLSLLQPADY